MRSTVRVLSLVCLTAFSARAQQKPLILHNASLVDGTGAPARQHVDIHDDLHRLRWLGRRGSCSQCQLRHETG